ncbi:MAG: MBL fold metallo-hydrolase [Pseudomonadota bacterium]|nr:MBL fold metallo-hydrolase [Pseudomonadota bacterium]
MSGHSFADPRHLRLPRALGQPMSFPAGWAVIQHPLHGIVLFDCGYGAAARTAMQRGLRRVYRSVIGACCLPGADPASVLAAANLSPADVRHVVLSHFHPDHVGGLREFPAAACFAHADAWRQVRDGGRLNHLHAQIWRELLPEDLGSRINLLESGCAVALQGAMAVFGHGWDLFGDGSLVAFPLPGHAEGQVGLALEVEGELVLLVADAFWRREQLEQVRAPHWWVRLLAIRDAKAYADTLRKLCWFRQERPDAWIIPSHCAATMVDWHRAHPAGLLGELTLG